MNAKNAENRDLNAKPPKKLSDAKPGNPDLASDRVFQVSWGLVYKVVCAPNHFKAEAIVATVNAKDPTGISSGWVISMPRQRSDSWNGINFKPCDACENRTHWLMNC